MKICSLSISFFHRSNCTCGLLCEIFRALLQIFFLETFWTLYCHRSWPFWTFSVECRHYKSKKIHINWEIDKSYFWKIMQLIIIMTTMLIKLIENVIYWNTNIVYNMYSTYTIHKQFIFLQSVQFSCIDLENIFVK